MNNNKPGLLQRWWGTSDAMIPPPQPRPKTIRSPLRTEQHILHLLLTVFTCGLWTPIWILASIHGNRAAR